MNDHRDRLVRRLTGIHPTGYPGARLSHAGVARLLLALVLIPIMLVLAGALTGCARNPPIPHRAEPVPAQCDSLCYQPCDVRIPPWQPTDPDSPAAWDELPDQVLIPARLRLWTCEQHRQACERCLDRLREAGVIR